MLINTEYEILNGSGKFVNFLGIDKIIKNDGLKITLENNKNIIVSHDHIFLANDKNMYANSLIPNQTYLTTIDGDFFVKSIEEVNESEFYDIIDSEDYNYFANDILNHNCSFLGSGDNFIAENYLIRIQENEIQVPIRQEYVDRNMWIWEDPNLGEEYIIAIDVSAGHGDDNSTINVLKKNEIIEEKIINKDGKIKKVKIKKNINEQVAEYYGKLSPQTLAEIAYYYGKQYNNAYCVIDITGGYGIQTIEKLIEFGYGDNNIHYTDVAHKPTRDRLSGYIKKGQKLMPDGKIIEVDLIPGFFIGNNRASVLLELQRSINLGDVIIKSSRLLSELKTFITVSGNRIADHKRSFHDDSIMGLAVGLYVINYDLAKFKQNKGNTEKMLNAIITGNEILEKNKQIPPINRNNSGLNPYIAHNWLFNGLKK